MPIETSQTRTLQRALEAVGSPVRLAEILECNVAELMAWLSGTQPTPPDAYLRALDIVSRGRI